VPKNHLVFFVRDLLCELDLSSIEALIQAKDPRSERPYDPRLMLWILLYGYCLGIYSSRRLERATWEDVSFLERELGSSGDTILNSLELSMVSPELQSRSRTKNTRWFFGTRSMAVGGNR